MSTRSRRFATHSLLLFLLFAGVMFAAGCATSRAEKEKDDQFFTSGSQEADRRADQRVPNEEGEGGAKGGTGGPQIAGAKGEQQGQPQAEKKVTLYDRLGGEEGIRAIVDDFVKRALEDPRVNWARKGVTKGGLFKRDESVEWKATPENVKRLKERFVQFISLAAGGPADYDGRGIRSVHTDMQISEPEFEAAIGDLKASLDKLQVSPDIQKELLALFESTRPQIVIKK